MINQSDRLKRSISKGGRMFEEFKKFILRGNVMDLAVGLIIGAAFGKIVTSLVNDIIMPPISLLMGEVAFPDRFIDLTNAGVKSLAEANDAGVPVLAWGSFIQTIIEFLIIGLAVFVIVKALNKLTEMHKKAEEAPAPTTKDCPYCASSIPVKATRCPHCTSQL